MLISYLTVILNKEGEDSMNKDKNAQDGGNIDTVETTPPKIGWDGGSIDDD